MQYNEQDLGVLGTSRDARVTVSQSFHACIRLNATVGTSNFTAVCTIWIFQAYLPLSFARRGSPFLQSDRGGGAGGQWGGGCCSPQTKI